MRNVHEFDGKVRIELEKNVKKEEEEKIWDDAEKYINKMGSGAQTMARSIYHDPMEKNMDMINKGVNARELLLTLLTKLNQMDDKQDQMTFYSLLEEQLDDMHRLGQCPQGRTIRLWQLLQSFS